MTTTLIPNESGNLEQNLMADRNGKILEYTDILHTLRWFTVDTSTTTSLAQSSSAADNSGLLLDELGGSV